MSPVTHALVTAAHLLDELGDDSRFCHVSAYDDGRAMVQLANRDLTVLAALADQFGVNIHRGAGWVGADGQTTREVSVTVVRDSVPVTFWTREQVQS